MKLRATLAGCLLVTTAYSMELNPLFQDSAVLQCNSRVPVWGTGRDGEKISVAFGGQNVSTVVSGGTWKIWLKPMKPNAAPQTLTVRGDTSRELSDILIGEVWVASGQSNMERQLGLRAGQQPITDWEREAAAANHPQIRQFQVQQTTAAVPQTTVKGNWTVCSPETVKDFSAVGYFFARDLLAARKVPIGIIHSAWGGTPAEAWTSETGLQALPEFAEPLAELKTLTNDPGLAKRKSEAKQNEWLGKVDRGSKPGAAWSAANLDTADWKPITLPAYIESAGYPRFDGVIWFRRSFDLPENWDGGDVELHLGGVDDMDTTWVNGEQVGMTNGWSAPRNYLIPASKLKRGANVIAIRVFDPAGGGGLYGGNDAMQLVFKAGGTTSSVPLSGEWQSKPGCTMRESGWPPAAFSESPNTPTMLYNGMIAPLLPYTIRGVIWYQGESNVGRERQYRTLFPAMIADWRRAWNQENLPFLFVQIAPHNGMSPEIREAQLLSWQRTKNTAMAVTLDCGDAKDIHPTHKQPVGARLALAARAVAYGEKIEFSGPVYESMKTKGAEAILKFTHSGGGLVAKDGDLTGFTLAGADKVYHPAKAEIRGDTIVVSAAAVSSPVAVRYAWANAPKGNLFNRAGLPASPFRTNVE
jgi:sialate O-acetylesterase